MSPLILFLVRMATASKVAYDATGTYENAVQKGIEKEVALWFRGNVMSIKELSGDSNRLTDEEIQLGLNKGKLYCVKAYKERTGKGLMESKNFVEDYFERTYLNFKVG